MPARAQPLQAAALSSRLTFESECWLSACSVFPVLNLSVVRCSICVTHEVGRMD